METADQKKLILDFIKRQKLAVISTADPSGQPESAVLEYGETDSLEIIFDTFNTYRKYQNLQVNPKVAFVIGWDEDVTVQYEGLARELSGEELREAQGQYFRKNPKAEKWANLPEIRYFKVSPTWVRYSDLNEKPWKIYEITF